MTVPQRNGDHDLISHRSVVNVIHILTQRLTNALRHQANTTVLLSRRHFAHRSQLHAEPRDLCRRPGHVVQQLEVQSMAHELFDALRALLVAICDVLLVQLQDGARRPCMMTATCQRREDVPFRYFLQYYARTLQEPMRHTNLQSCQQLIVWRKSRAQYFTPSR